MEIASRDFVRATRAASEEESDAASYGDASDESMPADGAPAEAVAAAPPQTLVASPSPTPTTSPSRADAPAPSQDEPDSARHIVYTASLQLGVFDVADAREKAERLPDTLGGYVQSLAQNVVILRIPSARLRDAMTAASGWGVVEARDMQAADVTEEWVDLDTRIRVLQQMQTQLAALLARANTVEEALRVRRALDEVTLELEQALGRKRRLVNLTSFSTLTIQLVERGPHDPVPTSNDPFPWVDGLGVEATEWK
jgi:hypothetical protein